MNTKKLAVVVAAVLASTCVFARPHGGFHGGPRGGWGGPRPVHHGGWGHHHHHHGWRGGWGWGAAGFLGGLATGALVRDIVAPAPVIYSAPAPVVVPTAPVVYPAAPVVYPAAPVVYPGVYRRW